VKKWRWRHSVRATLGRGEKRRRMGRGAVEDDEVGVALTRAREAVRRPGNDGKVAVAEEISGGGARARRGEEESRDGCSEDRARASTFYRGWREAEARGIQWLTSMPGLEDAGYSEWGGGEEI
jgi:hypothetical protein